MAFKFIKDWLSISGKRRHRSRHGDLIVSGEGEATVVVRFVPDSVKVFFVDKDPPPIPCHPHKPDECGAVVRWIGFGRYGIAISWDVQACRKLKFEVEGHIHL